MDSVNHLPRLLPQGNSTVNCLLPPNDTKPQKTKSKPCQTTVQYPFQSNQSKHQSKTASPHLRTLLSSDVASSTGFHTFTQLPQFSYVHTTSTGFHTFTQFPQVFIRSHIFHRFSYVHTRQKEIRMLQNSMKLIRIG